MVMVIWHTGSAGRRGGEGCCNKKEGEKPIDNQNLSFGADL